MDKIEKLIKYIDLKLKIEKILYPEESTATKRVLNDILDFIEDMEETI